MNLDCLLTLPVSFAHLYRQKHEFSTVIVFVSGWQVSRTLVSVDMARLAVASQFAAFGGVLCHLQELPFVTEHTP